ncbi:serine/threonine-protein kinase [Ideonella sp. BN130291]|uniref:serine/threonine-protein kinase n=1 Tax=Ideonella sp. BN130291 TaxID=3112940 RepID=UPI002E2696F2|nr:serine/threonine-protein kinase [Ideonella sp. BN130291]
MKALRDSFWHRALQSTRRPSGGPPASRLDPSASSAVSGEAGPTGALRPAPLLAGYRVERLIARGAQGMLYAATDPRTGAVVAIKTLPLATEYEGADLEQARKRFFQEADSAASLRHPDIVTVYGSGEASGEGFIVMELLAGCDLTRYTRPARLLPEPVVLRIGARVAEALAFSHAAGVVHRDIKPANVMVDLPRHQVKVTDFGIARVSDSARSRSGVMLGTPAFMAPEQLAGGAIDGRADLYALGVMLFQLLTGRLPYEAQSMGQLLLRIARGTPSHLSELRPGLPLALGELMDRLLQRQPAQRPRDGGEVAAELRQIAEAWTAQGPHVSGWAGSGSPAGEPHDPGHNPFRN